VVFDDASPCENTDRRSFRRLAIEQYAHDRLELITKFPSSDMFL